MAPDEIYILDERGEPRACLDRTAWAHWYEHDIEARVVAENYVGDFEVLTMFLALDYSTVPGSRTPILWHTMISHDAPKPVRALEAMCGGSREQAEAMHARVVRLVCQQMGIRYEYIQSPGSSRSD